MTRKNLFSRTESWAAVAGAVAALGAPVANAMTSSESGGAPAPAAQSMHDGSLNAVNAVQQPVIQDGWLRSSIEYSRSVQPTQDGWLNAQIAYENSKHQPNVTSSNQPSLMSAARSGSLGPSPAVYATTGSSASNFDTYFVPLGGGVLAALALASIALAVIRRNKPTLASA